MTTFVVLFIGLLAVVLILTPLIIHLSREVGILRLTLHDARLELVTAVRDADYHRMASEHASDGLVVQDMKARILWANPAYLKIFGVTFDEIVGRNPLEFALPPNDAVSPDEIEAFRYCADDPQDWSLHERLNRHNDGREFWNQMNLSYNLAPDGTQNAIVVCRDVTEQMEQKQKLHETSNKLQHEATHDGLTGVPNRAAFKTFIGDALRSGDGTPVGLLHIDLDNFKAVNDTHGHSGGDAVLTHTADVIRQNIRDSDLLARVGGDEFVVVCPQTSDLALLDDLSTRLLDVISKPFAWSNRLLKIEASIGAAISQSEKKPPKPCSFRPTLHFMRQSAPVATGSLSMTKTCTIVTPFKAAAPSNLPMPSTLEPWIIGSNRQCRLRRARSSVWKRLYAGFTPLMV